MILIRLRNWGRRNNRLFSMLMDLPCLMRLRLPRWVLFFSIFVLRASCFPAYNSSCQETRWLVVPRMLCSYAEGIKDCVWWSYPNCLWVFFFIYLQTTSLPELPLMFPSTPRSGLFAGRRTKLTISEPKQTGWKSQEIVQLRFDVAPFHLSILASFLLSVPFSFSFSYLSHVYSMPFPVWWCYGFNEYMLPFIPSIFDWGSLLHVIYKLPWIDYRCPSIGIEVMSLLSPIITITITYSYCNSYRCILIFVQHYTVCTIIAIERKRSSNLPA